MWSVYLQNHTHKHARAHTCKPARTHKHTHTDTHTLARPHSLSLSLSLDNKKTKMLAQITDPFKFSRDSCTVTTSQVISLIRSLSAGLTLSAVSLRVHNTAPCPSGAPLARATLNPQFTGYWHDKVVSLLMPPQEANWTF